MGNLVKGGGASAKQVGPGATRKVLAYGGGLMLAEICNETGSEGALHAHPHEQITYVLSGEFEYRLGAECFIMKAGDSVYVEPNVTHGVRCLSRGMLLDAFTPCREDFLE